MLSLISAALIMLGGGSDMTREVDMPYRDSTITLKKYVMCIYTSGPNRSQSKEEAEELQRRHLAHQDTLADKGVLLVAGPFEGHPEKRGILIFDVGTIEEAEPYVKADPMVQAGRLAFELIPWWTMKGSVIR